MSEARDFDAEFYYLTADEPDIQVPIIELDEQQVMLDVLSGTDFREVLLANFYMWRNHLKVKTISLKEKNQIVAAELMRVMDANFEWVDEDKISVIGNCVFGMGASLNDIKYGYCIDNSLRLVGKVHGTVGDTFMPFDPDAVSRPSEIDNSTIVHNSPHILMKDVEVYSAEHHVLQGELPFVRIPLEETQLEFSRVVPVKA